MAAEQDELDPGHRIPSVYDRAGEIYSTVQLLFLLFSALLLLHIFAPNLYCITKSTKVSVNTNLVIRIRHYERLNAIFSYSPQ